MPVITFTIYWIKYQNLLVDALRCLRLTFSLSHPPCLKSTNRISHLGNKHHPVFAEQTMVPFQPVPGRQGKGQPSNSGPYRSINILNSFNAPESSSLLTLRCVLTWEPLARHHTQSKWDLKFKKKLIIFGIVLDEKNIKHILVTDGHSPESEKVEKKKKTKACFI